MDTDEQLTKYLTDAHSIEEQSLQQMRQAPEIAGEPQLARALREHLTETEEHEQRIRSLLEQRGASPSAVKDTIMKAGGSGFVLFARANADTPGKLASHALSYEALEWASYDLLARTAERLDEPDVAAVARGIRDEERAMMERIEALFDETAEASLNSLPRDGVEQQLRMYLADAHAIEAQSIQLLESGKQMVQEATLSELFEEHLTESRRQQERLEQLLDGVDGDASWIKDAGMRLGALNWGMFFQAHPDTPGKLAGFAYAFEHLEIGGYEQLRRVAQRAEARQAVEAVDGILSEERRAAERVRAAFDDAVSGSLAAQVH